MNRNAQDGRAISDYWRLCEEFTVLQASLLIVGCDPASEFSECQSWNVQDRPQGYDAVKQAISSALRANSLDGELCEITLTDMDGDLIDHLDGSIDVYLSTVKKESLVKWLRSNGVRDGFFFPKSSSEPEYLTSENNDRFAPKLAAAVRAWQAVTKPNGKSPKQALVKWLREHAAEFGLSDDEGKPNETGIEEVAKVANWQPGGGAAKTPGA